MHRMLAVLVAETGDAAASARVLLSDLPDERVTAILLATPLIPFTPEAPRRCPRSCGT
ncbi:hypothetical protein [Nonomuraea helvata]|uniref:Uncharacterized protein n=1 Tax=Nonomuraea helvata TaxID=37484 RepID=A0ABV5SAF0_9ACTN